MKVSQLIDELKKLDPEREVILARDEEGNGFNQLWNVDDNAVIDDAYEETGIHHLTPGLEDSGYTDEDIIEGKRVVILWP